MVLVVLKAGGSVRNGRPTKKCPGVSEIWSRLSKLMAHTRRELRRISMLWIAKVECFSHVVMLEKLYRRLPQTTKIRSIGRWELHEIFRLLTYILMDLKDSLFSEKICMSSRSASWKFVILSKQIFIGRFRWLQYRSNAAKEALVDRSNTISIRVAIHTKIHMYLSVDLNPRTLRRCKFDRTGKV